MQRADKPAYSRNVMHGNQSNKTGCTEAFQRHIDKKRRPDKEAKLRAGKFRALHVQHSHEEHIVKGKPPKVLKMSIKPCRECRFTIPTTPKNNNIFDQTCTRCRDLHDLCMRDLRGFFKIKSFATDYEHVEVVDA